MSQGVDQGEVFDPEVLLAALPPQIKALGLSENALHTMVQIYNGFCVMPGFMETEGALIWFHVFQEMEAISHGHEGALKNLVMRAFTDKISCTDILNFYGLPNTAFIDVVNGSLDRTDSAVLRLYIRFEGDRMLEASFTDKFGFHID